MADRDEVERTVVRGQAQHPLQLGVVESADGDRAQAEGHGLEQDVLRTMPGFQLRLAGSAGFPRCGRQPAVASGARPSSASR